MPDVGPTGSTVGAPDGRPAVWRAAIGPAVVIVALLVAQLVPVWTVAHWPSQDGPEHAYNAVLLLEMNRPDRPAYRRFFRVNPKPVPNWAAAVVTAGLLRVGLPPATADKVIVTGCLAAFYAAAVYAVRGVRPAARYEPLVVLPFAMNLFVFLGFYNFCGSLAVLLVVFGYQARRGDRPTTVGRLLALAGLGTLLYFCHLVSFGVAGCFLGLWAAGAGVSGGGTAADRARRVGRAAVVPLVALAPPVALSLLFLGRQPLDARDFASDLPARVERFLTWGNSVHQRDAVVSAAVTLAFAAATAVVVRDRWRAGPAGPRPGPPPRRGGDVLAVTAAVTAVASLVAPNVISGGSYVMCRLNLIAVTTWAVWLAAQPLPAWLGPALRAGAAAATVVLLVTAARVVRTEDRYVTDYQSAAGAIPPGATFLPVSYAARLDQAPLNRPPFRWVDCMAHAAGWLAIDRHAVNVTDYEAATGYFPTRFRPGPDRLPAAGHVSPSRYLKATGIAADFVVVWTGGVGPASDIDREVAADLARDYRLVFRSPTGYALVYRRASVPAGRAPRPSPSAEPTR